MSTPIYRPNTPDGTPRGPATEFRAIGETTRRLKAASDSLATLVAATQGDISTLQGDISTLQGDVTAAQADILAIQGGVLTLQGDMTDAQADILALQGGLADAQADIVAIQAALGASGTASVILELSAPLTVPQSGTVTVSWGTEVLDQPNAWSAGAPDRIIAPAGFSLVRLTAGFMWATSTNANSVALRKNGTIIAHVYTSASARTAGTVSRLIPTTAGDYFQVTVYNGTTTASRDISATPETFFTAEFMK